MIFSRLASIACTIVALLVLGTAFGLAQGGLAEEASSGYLIAAFLFAISALFLWVENKGR